MHVVQSGVLQPSVVISSIRPSSNVNVRGHVDWVTWNRIRPYTNISL